MKRSLKLLVFTGFLAAVTPGFSAGNDDSAPLLMSRTGGGTTWSDLEELQKAAAGGTPEALAALGEMIVTGDQVPKDVPKGVEMLERAAKAGQANAAFRLGKLYEDGDGVPRDASKALDYYLQAAKAGVATAQYNLGAMYVSARNGIKRDYKEGLAWLIIAARNGSPAEGEQRVRERLTATRRTAVIAEAEKRATELEAELKAAAAPKTKAKASATP
jgi:TPR repeat protein